MFRVIETTAKMKAQVLAVVLTLGLVAVAQVAALPFPFSNCKKTPSSFSVSSTITVKPNNTYCFTIRVQKPAGCNDYCCTADLRKFELNVNPSCRIPGVKLRSTLNGAPTPTQATLDPAPGTAAGVILRIPNLGLRFDNADGAEICVSLGTNAGGKGCLSLDQLCVPPAGGAPGTCETALYDSKNDCCPTGPASDNVINFDTIPPINCSCDFNKGSTPFRTVGSVVSTAGAKTSTHCFSITSNNDYTSSGCGPVDRLLKIEMYAKQSLSSSIKNLYLYPTTGAPVTLSASWNGANSNTLKFTPINWSIAQGANAKICVELKNPATINEFCQGPSCYFFLFNANRACCPMYTVPLV